MGKVIVAVIVIGLAAWWWLGRDPVEVAYQKCLKRVESEMSKATATDTRSPTEKAMADAVKGFGSALGNAGCEAMRSACKENREGAVCKAAMAQF